MMHFVMAGASDLNRWHCIEALGCVKPVASVKSVASGKENAMLTYRAQQLGPLAPATSPDWSPRNSALTFQGPGLKAGNQLFLNLQLPKPQEQGCRGSPACAAGDGPAPALLRGRASANTP